MLRPGMVPFDPRLTPPAQPAESPTTTGLSYPTAPNPGLAEPDIARRDG
jgi:hypothetical protein